MYTIRPPSHFANLLDLLFIVLFFIPSGFYYVRYIIAPHEIVNTGHIKRLNGGLFLAIQTEKTGARRNVSVANCKYDFFFHSSPLLLAQHSCKICMELLKIY